MPSFDLIGQHYHMENVLLSSQGFFKPVGHALGVLHDALRFKAKDATLNCLMGEVAL